MGGANRFASMMTNTSPNHRVIVSAVRCAEEEEADGLAAGKGVVVCDTAEDAKKAAAEMLSLIHI